MREGEGTNLIEFSGKVRPSMPPILEEVGGNLTAEKTFAHDRFELLKLKHLLKFASNSTEISNTVKNNGTRVSEIAAEFSSSATREGKLRM